MSFDVSAAAYDSFMGRYSQPLARVFADLVDIAPGHSVLDVGCGPGALTEVLARRCGAGNVTAVDPSASFVAAAQARLPGVTVLAGSAEALAFPDGAFDATLAQLVVHFLSDPVAGLREMARVTAPGGTVAACVWDYAGGRGPLSLFWRAVQEIDASASDESRLAGAAEGGLAELFRAAGMAGSQSTTLSVALAHETVEDWWAPYTLGVGPAGDLVARLDPAGVARLRSVCADLLPPPPFTVQAHAWTVTWRKP